jgi:hypothetical protein
MGYYSHVNETTNLPDIMIAIIKPLSSKLLSNIIGSEHRARLSSHRAVLLLTELDEFGHYMVEEIKTGLVYPADKKHIMRVSSATKDQLAELV